MKKRHGGGGVVGQRMVLLLGVLLLGGSSALATQLSDFLFSKGMVDFGEGKFEDALEKFRQGAEDEPSDPSLQFMLGSTYNKLGGYQLARQALERALELDPELRQVHYELGVALFNLGLLEEALKQFQLAQEFEPDRALTHYYQGFVLHELRRYDLSPRFFIRARELASELSLTARYYTGIAYLRQGDLKLAEAEFQGAIEADPESDVAESAGRFLKETRELLKQVRPFRFVVNVGSEYDSNVSSLPEGLQPDALQLAREGDFREIFFASIEYRPLITPTASLGVGYTFNQSVHHTLSQFDLQSHGLFFSATRLLQPVQVRFDGAAEMHFLGGHTLLQRNVLSPSLNLIEAPWAVTNLSYRFQTLRRFDDTQRDGLNNGIGVQQFFLFERGTRIIRIGFTLEIENTDSPRFDFVGYEVSTGFVHPFFRDTPYEVTLSLDFRHSKRDYLKVVSGRLAAEADPLLDRRREETRQAYSIGLTKPVGRWLEVALRYSLAVNHGNTPVRVDPFDYTRNLASIILGFKF